MKKGMQKLSYSETLRIIADNLDAGLSVVSGIVAIDESGDEILIYGCDLNSILLDFDNYTYYRKPPTHIVNGFEVPAPMAEAPARGTGYYAEYPTSSTWCAFLRWTNCDKHVLERGLCHETKEAAIANAKARLGINPYEDNANES